jgi:hypothetical protein
VKLNAGTHIRRGVTNKVDGWGKGGGIQCETMGKRVGTFSNKRILTK